MSLKPATNSLSISGTTLLLNGQPCHLQGLSFFNALYNPSFNASREVKTAWLRKFKQNGINLLRVWCQWDFVDRTFVDLAEDHSMYTPQGYVREEYMLRLSELLELLDQEDMLMELTLFSHEKKPYFSSNTLEFTSLDMARLLRPYRNLILQIWNEESQDWQRCFEGIKGDDPRRLVTNSPGGADNLGDDLQNQTLDLLTPHTARGGSERFWEAAPRQVARLMERFRKPVIDDEPARDGTPHYGGIPGGTRPEQHIEQIRRVRALGGYHIYHHDMFQLGYGSPTIPPSGIPDPDFSPFQREVFDFLQGHPTW